MKNYLQKGAALSLIARVPVASGGLVVEGVIAGIAGTDAGIGAPVEVHVEGCFALPKPLEEVWAPGDAIYADPVALVCSNSPATGFVLMGAAIAGAANPSPTGKVRLNGSFPAAAEG